MKEQVLQVSRLSYCIGERNILQEISLTIQQGEVVALLGENGSGKTSLLECICQILKPSQGDVSFFGSLPLSACKMRVGVLWDSPVLFPMMRVRELIDFMRSIYRLDQSSPYLAYLTQQLRLETLGESFYYQLSKGERKRVAMMTAMMHQPELLILDEPTAEIDPMMRERLWQDLILQRQKAVLFSTHLWEEAKLYANKIYFIHQGQFISEGLSPTEHLVSSGYDHKLVLPKGINLSFQDSILRSEGEQFIHLFLKSDEWALVETQLQKQRIAYSLLPLTIEDVYRIKQLSL